MIFQYWSQIKKSTAFKLAVTTVVSYVLYLLAGFLVPLLLAIGLAFALYPLVNSIAKVRMAHGMIKLSRVVAIVLSLMAFCIFVLIAVGFILLPLFGQMNEFLQLLPALTAKANANAASLDALINNEAALPVLPSSFDMLVDDAMNAAMSFITAMLRNLFRSSMDIAQNLIGLLIVPFLSFYFLKDWRDLREMAINLFNYEDQQLAATVIDEIGYTLSAYIRGLAKCSLVSCFCIAVGTAYIGIDFPMVLGFWALLAEMVPVVGPLMGAVPAIFIAYGQSPSAALDVAIFYLVYYQLDANYIMPRIMGQKIDVHPVILIGSLLIGAKLFGIVGMVFAVPVAAVYRVLYKQLWHMGERGV